MKRERAKEIAENKVRLHAQKLMEKEAHRAVAVAEDDMDFYRWRVWTHQCNRGLLCVRRRRRTVDAADGLADEHCGRASLTLPRALVVAVALMICVAIAMMGRRADGPGL